MILPSMRCRVFPLSARGDEALFSLFNFMFDIPLVIGLFHPSLHELTISATPPAQSVLYTYRVFLSSLYDV